MSHWLFDRVTFCVCSNILRCRTTGPYLRGEGTGSPHHRNKKTIFWQCKKRPAKCERWRTVCLHYCDARKSHLASIKCKKPLGRPGLCPGPRWESLQRSPRPASWWANELAAPSPKTPPRSRPFRPRLSPPPNFQTFSELSYGPAARHRLQCKRSLTSVSM